MKEPVRATQGHKEHSIIHLIDEKTEVQGDRCLKVSDPREAETGTETPGALSFD